MSPMLMLHAESIATVSRSVRMRVNERQERCPVRIGDISSNCQTLPDAGFIPLTAHLHYSQMTAMRYARPQRSMPHARSALYTYCIRSHVRLCLIIASHHAARACRTLPHPAMLD